MEIEYVKNKKYDVANTLENGDCLKVTNLQNFIPIYKNFFKLTNNNFNSINLKHQFSIVKFLENISYNKFLCLVKNNKDDSIKKQNIFIKYSPLLDPIKYMVGKYKNENYQLFNLPKLDASHSCKKVDDLNNSAYTDGFFSFLSDLLLTNFNFVNGTKYYGSFIANKNDFRVNIFDDIEYLDESKFFNLNKDTLFKIDDSFYDELIGNSSRTNKKKLFIGEELSLEKIDDINSDLKLIDTIFQVPTKENLKFHDINNSVIYENKLIETKTTKSSSCSSRSSNTHNSNISDSECYSSNSNLDTSETESSLSDNFSLTDEECIYAYINNFPVDIICLECCHETLDYYMLNNDVDPEEWSAIFLQIIMILITYQKTFSFTHNDLHTNNIMYIHTEKTYLVYKYNNSYYKVKTFGKIWKIIDFGRAIYKYKGKTICSDSFNSNGDAATQYNCEPFYNDKKPILEPNYSFDLCRLGCSLFDYFIDDISDTENIEELDEIQRLVLEWCLDDNKKNVLYKKSGEERYPEFKLYKMIARLCHNNTPQLQLEKKLFSQYKCNKKSVKKLKIIDIDIIEYMG